MAQTQTRNTDISDEVATLSEQVQSLKSDLAAITKTLGGVAVAVQGKAGDEASEQMAKLRQRGVDEVTAMRNRAEAMGQEAADAVRAQPAAAVGIAVCVGYLIGFMTGKK